MAIKGLEEVLRAHPLFAGLNDTFCALVCGCARNMRFNAGTFLFHAGDPADRIYLLRHGRVALELSDPARGTIDFQTLGEGEVVGVSWLVPPYRWTYTARAVELVRAIAIDAKCLRDKCEADHDLGYEMMKRFTPVLVERLHATRLQLLDVYGTPD